MCVEDPFLQIQSQFTDLIIGIYTSTSFGHQKTIT